MAEEDHTVSRAQDPPGGQVQRMGELQALLARVRAATGPDWKLDDAIWNALAPDDYFGSEARMFTASLDAALALVELALGPQWSVCIAYAVPGRLGHIGTSCRIAGDHLFGEPVGFVHANVAPPLAVLTALLTALSHQQPHDQIREGQG